MASMAKNLWRQIELSLTSRSFSTLFFLLLITGRYQLFSLVRLIGFSIRINNVIIIIASLMYNVRRFTRMYCLLDMKALLGKKLACVQTSPISFVALGKKDVCVTASLIVFQSHAVFPGSLERTVIGH